MSYAIETKKRKFDRILEALTDGAASASRSSLASHNSVSATSLLHDAASDSSKRRRITTNSQSTTSTPSSTTLLTGHYLPSSRAAFLQRLETFRDVTQWHVPSTDPINAATWAKRGWICVDADTVCCGACRERLHIDLDLDSQFLKPQEPEARTEDEPSEEDDGLAFTSELYDSIIKRYQEMVVTGHAEGCLWRTRGSDDSIQRIEGLLNTSIAVLALRRRYESIMTRPEEIPEVTSAPSSALVDLQELERFRFEGEEHVDLNALKLAVFGWERKCEDVIECRHCFRSLGLWLYRGDSPAIERLDGVENHLEYCPWRSAAAQATETVLGPRRASDASSPKKERVPGWVLVYQAVVKDNRKKRGLVGLTTSAPTSEGDVTTDSGGSLTPDQRERKMRDLLRRIKEIKKPFNVKSLLKRKDKTKV